MTAISFEQIKTQYPDEWVLVKIEDEATQSKSGVVLLHGKDYLEICYKSSEIAKNFLTTILFTGEQNKKRKWLKAIVNLS